MLGKYGLPATCGTTQSAQRQQARAAVFVELEKAEDGTDFARLAWLVEDLIYDDLLKGTGWGRRRGWCRERLEECHTLAQARAPVSGLCIWLQVVWHSTELAQA